MRPAPPRHERSSQLRFVGNTLTSRLQIQSRLRATYSRAALLLSLIGATLPAHASLFSGDTLDLVADILAWIVLFIAPVIAIVVFWLIHIMPERIAEKRHHPQATAIKTLCLLSLFFGGLLWPLAWLWAYSRPVLHKIAYGTDKIVPEHAVETVEVEEEVVIEDVIVPPDGPVGEQTVPAGKHRQMHATR